MESSIWQYTKIRRLKQSKSSKNWKIKYGFMAFSYNVFDFGSVVIFFCYEEFIKFLLMTEAYSDV